MTTKTEQEFFECFEIPKLCCKKYLTACTRYGECEECENYDKNFGTYPIITDNILLKLMCYLSRYYLDLIPEYACYKTIEQLKENVLKQSMTFMSSTHKPMLYLEDVRKIIYGGQSGKC